MAKLASQQTVNLTIPGSSPGGAAIEITTLLGPRSDTLRKSGEVSRHLNLEQAEVCIRWLLVSNRSK